MRHFDLTRRDCESCLQLLAVLEQAVCSPERLARACEEGLRELVPHSQAQFVDSDAAGASHAEGELPLSEDPRDRARLVLRRPGVPLTARERARLDLIAPHLIFLYAQARRNLRPSLAWTTQGITPREQEVLRWLSCGKTDADIAALLAISPRTVHKHLEHIYVKLGVETRTAAVMRARRLD